MEIVKVENSPFIERVINKIWIVEVFVIILFIGFLTKPNIFFLGFILILQAFWIIRILIEEKFYITKIEFDQCRIKFSGSRYNKLFQEDFDLKEIEIRFKILHRRGFFPYRLEFFDKENNVVLYQYITGKFDKPTVIRLFKLFKDAKKQDLTLDEKFICGDL